MKIARAIARDGRVFTATAGGYEIKAKDQADQDAVKKQALMSEHVSMSLARLLRPQAAHRWLLPHIAAITPQYIEMVLRGALAGNHVQQWELFDLMLDTWPELSACQQELTYGVSRLKLIFEPFAEEDEDPTPTAKERCRVVSTALRRMAPDAAADENDLEGTLKDILDGWFRGVTCLEVQWHVIKALKGQLVAPKSTFWVHPVCFAFDSNGRLGLRTDGHGNAEAGYSGMSFQPHAGMVGEFPEHKFLIGIHKAKSGTALGGALLRPLAWWWCAANFSADWLLNLAQIFGLPFRWATYDPTAAAETVSGICAMLQNMGSAGWAAFPTGTKMELIDTAKTGDHSPQGELLDRADRYARLLILGQTLSGGQSASRGGGKAFGQVESEVKCQRIDAAGRYACRVFNTQLIPSILALNFGDTDEAPTIRLLEDEEGDMNEAKRDMELAKGGLKIPAAFIRKKYGIPAPAEGEETIGGAADPQNGEEEKAEQEKQIKARLRDISAITDDAIFARELRALADDV